MNTKKLFVCQCNICRSPMAEVILKNMMSQYNNVEIASVGMSGEKEGEDMTVEAPKCRSAYNILFENRQAVVFCVEDYLKYDLIVFMDEWNKINLKIRCMDDPLHKIFKLLEFSRTTKGMSDDDAMLYTNVTDPYHSNNYEQTFSEICEGCAKLKERIFESNE